jgi:hypothetical protein
MTRTKTLIMGPALALVVGLVSSSAMAKDVDLGKHGADEIKSICDRAGGKFVSDGQTYGCSKKCEGGTCAVICDKDDGCFGTTPRDRQQVGANGERGVVDALNATTNTSEHDNKGFPWGLIGLLGLAGLLSLNRRHDRHGVS